MKRRSFLQAAVAGTAAIQTRHSRGATPSKGYEPPHIVNDYSLFLPGEKEALAESITIRSLSRTGATVGIGRTSRELRLGESLQGWQLLSTTDINGTETAILEKTVSHQGALVWVTESQGVILRIDKRVGKLENIRPRAVNASGGVSFVRQVPYVPGPDAAGNYILDSNEDPRYENVAALGAEYVGFTLVGNEQAGPLRSLFLEADGTSRQLADEPRGAAAWAPDLTRALFSPHEFLPGDAPSVFRYRPGYSKRTLLGGYLPVANIGVWNPETQGGYEVIVLLPPGTEAKPMARIRWQWKDRRSETDHFWNASAGEFYSALAGVANRWQHLFEDNMRVDIPDPWLVDAARAGITLSRCSYRGLEPTYQIGEGAYTKIPERSHALFPVAHYEFIWAHQLWNLTAESNEYFQHYLDHYILPDGNFLYNTQDQVEAPLNTGVFLWNSARAYDYTHDLASFDKRLPVLRRMIDYVVRRYEYGKSQFPPDDRRHGLIWGSPEADLGDPANDFPNSHPLYFQNSTWTWRGFREHARVLALAAREHSRPELAEEAKRLESIAMEMRPLIERSLSATIAASNSAMRQAGITPFSPDDIHRRPEQLSSYENHRFMMDWFTADWGDPALDRGHFLHREIAGMQLMGMDTNGAVARTSNFMEHGTLAGRIREEDYRPFLLTLYGLVCYAADSGNRYAPEDAYLPRSFPGDGNPYQWSSVVNSVLQPTLGLRWLLCYEESDREICHLQKAAPKHWFARGEVIHVENCPTRFGPLTWETRASGAGGWDITIEHGPSFGATIVVHVHPPDGKALQRSNAGVVRGTTVVLEANLLPAPRRLAFHVQ